MNKKTAISKKARRAAQIRRLMENHPGLTKKDAEFAVRTVIGLTHCAALFVSTMTSNFHKRKGESIENFNHRVEHSAIREMMQNIIEQVGSFICANKDFREVLKQDCKTFGQEDFTNKLFADFVFDTFYGTEGVADCIESYCAAKVKKN